jgi:lipopolysaccharide transport system ATP-binding protein
LLLKPFDGTPGKTAGMTAAIEVLGVGKEYLRGVHHSHTRLLSQLISQWGSTLLGRKGEPAGAADVEPFWALRDVSLTVDPGEVVGIVGRNGSGKSTLLKIIAQITAPTTGEVRLRGRTGTLLEVGTGFHPELSGRENVFLNGAILGMNRAEIARKFDEIVDFSGVEAFIDTPVKRYSSGMQTRLAFSVAAHLDPEILIVDEVLAVGDAEFQKKCLGKMNEVSRSGRTVLFVSHNMNAVDQLCDRVIWLDRGRVVEDSIDTYSVTSKYIFGDRNRALVGEIVASGDVQLDNEFFSFESLRVKDSAGRTIVGSISASEEVFVEVTLQIKKLNHALSFGYSIFDEAGATVYWTMTTDTNDQFVHDIRPGRLELSTRIPPRFLNQGLYRLDFMSGLHYSHWFAEPGATNLAIFLRIEGGMSDSVYWRQHRPGVVAPVFPWRLEQEMVRSD